MEVQKRNLEMIPVKRNPYLADYERERRGRRNRRSRGGLNRAKARQIAKRRQQVSRIKRTAVILGVFTLFVLGIDALVRSGRAEAAGAQGSASGSGRYAGADDGSAGQDKNADAQPSGFVMQGIPASKFAGHPDWEENFLTPNEYSRPGDALEEVKNIFVHYTANPGTSAAQNRSYFERQKDEHKASVSSHFIIGYDGEIIQCIPLNEIAYAVQTRNFDSVSIECCYKAQDGSFTQETYDSLISLLAWLTDAYDLETEDILRHYDCGGKKCPIYYTEHEDAWKKLKEDVQACRDDA